MKNIIFFSKLKKGEVFRFLGMNKIYKVVSVGKKQITYKSNSDENAKDEIFTFADAGQSKVVIQ